MNSSNRGCRGYRPNEDVPALLFIKLEVFCEMEHFIKFTHSMQKQSYLSQYYNQWSKIEHPPAPSAQPDSLAPPTSTPAFTPTATNASKNGQKYISQHLVQKKLSSLPDSLHFHHPSPPKASKAGKTIPIHNPRKHSKKDQKKTKKASRALERYRYVSIIVDLPNFGKPQHTNQYRTCSQRNFNDLESASRDVILICMAVVVLSIGLVLVK